MRWRYYELLWLIRHLGPFLSQNPADASLASLRNFFLEVKNKMATSDNCKIMFWAISLLLSQLETLFWCISPCFHGQRIQ